MRVALVLTVIAGLVTSAVARPARGPVQPALAIVVVVDTSSAMHGRKLDAVKAALRAAFRGLGPGQQLAVVSFSTEATVVIPFDATANQREAGLGLLQPRSRALYRPGFEVAFELLAHLTIQPKHVILITGTNGDMDGVSEILTDMLGSHIITSAIGLPGVDHSLPGRIVEAGAGFVTEIEELGTLSKELGVMIRAELE